ncbi:MAG: hypothetical protein PHQ86_06590 [Dehalococcoidales bacterium]|nr:hypothetical protein [Dehalococcoidales bacterium]
MVENYMLDPKVKYYFEQWMKSPTRFRGHAIDEKRFHMFVKTCINYARNRDEDVERVLISDSLRSSIHEYIRAQSDTPEHLYRDEANRYIWHFADIVTYEATELE